MSRIVKYFNPNKPTLIEPRNKEEFVFWKGPISGRTVGIQKGDILEIQVAKFLKDKSRKTHGREVLTIKLPNEIDFRVL